MGGLLPVIFGLILAGVGAVIGIQEYSRATTNSNINQMVSTVNQMREAITSLYSSAGTYSAVSVTDVAKVLPNSAVNAAKTAINNAFGGTVTLQSGTVTTAGDAYQIIASNIPQEACQRLAVMDFGRSEIAVAAGPSITSVTTTNGTTPPMTVAAANTACSATRNSVGWLFQ